MTNRERVIAAIRHESVDRVPYFVRFTSAMLEKMVDYTGDADFFAHMGNAYEMISLKIEPVPEGRPFHVIDEYGTIWNRTEDRDIGAPLNCVIPSVEAIEGYQAAVVDEAHLRERCETLLKLAAGERFSAVHGSSPLFERAWMLCGMQDFFCYLYSDPELVHRLMRKLCDREHRRLNIVLQYPIDCVFYTDDYGQQNSLMISPEAWREFVKPYLAELFDHIKGAGKYVELHSCGDNRLIMDDLIDMGLDIYNTFQPEIYTLDYAKILAGRLAVRGAVSTQRDLPRCEPAEIREIVRATKTAFQNRGLIIGPTHDVPPDVPPENILAMLDEMAR